MFDIVIIGSGAAGLTTALSVATDLNVLILTASSQNGSNTKLAQGGIAASYKASKESIANHLADTYKAGCYTNDIGATELLIENSSAAIDFLIEKGVNFDKKNGEFDLTSEAAHSERRIFHAQGDATGKEIYESLYASASKQSNITILDRAFVTTVSEVTDGQYLVSYSRDSLGYQIMTNNLVIACGGYGNLFSTTSNSKYISGSSVMIASQLGLTLSNLHLMQFHPTGFCDQEKQYHLLTESLRGEGARLYSPSVGYFMEAIHPLADLAPRDITSRAVQRLIDEGNQVFLDCTSLSNIGDINKRFGTVAKTVSGSGLDLSKDLIPVCPVAHYSIGGIAIDVNGLTSKPRIYAVGEAAMSGVHGSNRLASNSLLECIVYGRVVGANLSRKNQFEITEGAPVVAISDSFLASVQEILSTYCSIVRTTNGLNLALEQIDMLVVSNQLEGNLKNIATQLVIDCLNNDSSGCHYKECNE